MRYAEAEFVGGPAHGKIYAIHNEPQPVMYVASLAPAWNIFGDYIDEIKVVETVRHEYFLQGLDYRSNRHVYVWKEYTPSGAIYG